MPQIGYSEVQVGHLKIGCLFSEQIVLLNIITGQKMLMKTYLHGKQERLAISLNVQQRKIDSEIFYIKL